MTNDTRTTSRMLTLALAASLAIACGDERPQGVSSETRVPPSPIGDPCSVRTPGCPCQTEGSTSPCTVKRISGGYVACSTGTMTCGTDGKWGACEGAATEWVEDAGSD